MFRRLAMEDGGKREKYIRTFPLPSPFFFSLSLSNTRAHTMAARMIIEKAKLESSIRTQLTLLLFPFCIGLLRKAWIHFFPLATAKSCKLCSVALVERRVLGMTQN